MPLFGSSKKSPQELVKSLRDSLNVLEREQQGKKNEKATEDVSKNLVAMKNMLFGTGDQEPQTELVAQLAQEFYNSDLFTQLFDNLHRLDFESKKDVALIFNNILRRQIGTRVPTVEYICNKSELLFTLINGYKTQEIALNSGMMLRECLRHEPLAKIVLLSETFYSFFTFVEMSTFDIASDAFTTFKSLLAALSHPSDVSRDNDYVDRLELLTRHKIMAAEFLDKNYDKFFEHYKNLLDSDNYVTRRQSLKLLGELLLDRHNFSVMTRYISNPDNLKLMMNLLRDKSRNIQFEAFHVFKVFVANPNKATPILEILLKNKDKLVDFLSNFHSDRTEDEQFNDEKTYLIKQIKDLAPE